MLPQNPSGLGSGWTDITLKGGTNPKIPKRYRGPRGSEIEFDPANPDAAPGTWEAEDHWHEWDPNKGKKGARVDDHLSPGDPILGPDGEARISISERIGQFVQDHPTATKAIVGGAIVGAAIVSGGAAAGIAASIAIGEQLATP